MIEQMNEIVMKNKDMLYNEKGYLSVVKQRLRKKRLSLLSEIIEKVEEK